MILLALSAIILPLTFMMILRLPAKVGMSISAVVVAAIAWLAWHMTPLAIAASAAQGIHRALTIGFILFGALVLMKTMQATGAMDRIKLGLHAVSPDMRVQTIVVAFSFIAMLEGISGFGTPAIIAAPLLMVLGFKPLAAASLALLGDTMACTFGAVATPLIVGLENIPIYSSDLVALVGAQVTLFDLIIAPLLALGLVAILIFAFSTQTHHQKWRSLVEIAPWAFFIGVVHAASAVIFVRLVGPEFTSIIAGTISLIVASITARRGWLTPPTVWRHHANADQAVQTTAAPIAHMPIWRAWLPYAIVMIALLISRLVGPIQYWLLTALDASWNDIFGFQAISSSWNILYSPGFILLIGALSASLVGTKSAKALFQSIPAATKATTTALLALIPTLIMVQIFTNSGINTSGLAAMPIFIAETLAASFNTLWLVIAPLLGAIGALIAGSATVSTLTMAPVQYSIALDTGLPFVVILALQMIGAAAGNTIAIHNVVAASTVVGLTHKEGLIIRKLIIPTICYVAIASLIGLILSLALPNSVYVAFNAIM